MNMRASAPKKDKSGDEYIPFMLSDYIKNPIRIARTEANLKQQELATRLNVTQGYHYN